MFARDDILVALTPPIGHRPEWASLVAYLKVARGTELAVERSELALVDAAGRTLETRRDAFGLAAGMRIAGPYSRSFGDDTLRPNKAVHARWRLNEFSLDAGLVFSESEWQAPRVVYLPLQVPLADDCHILVRLVNLGEAPINLANGMREAVCWVDGVPYASTAGRVWNGGYLVQPRQATTRRFRLADFPWAPRHGTHEVSLEMVGARSPAEVVTWRGEPWLDERF